jgi:hypothetical protein
MNGAQTFLESSVTHSGSGHHLSAGYKIAPIDYGPWQVLPDQFHPAERGREAPIVRNSSWAQSSLPSSRASWSEVFQAGGLCSVALDFVPPRRPKSATNARCARFSSMLDLAVLIAAQGEDACEIRLLRFLRDF